MYILTVVELSLLGLAVLLEAQAQQDDGSGKTYLEQTETSWDGQTAWFTGSTCQCNGWASRCQFSSSLYRETGNGVECLQCGGGRAGAHCERCKEDHFLQAGTEVCQPCDCNPAGSTGGQCDEAGQCPCRPGVSGLTCHSCTQNSWNFPTCRPCKCFPPGSRHNTGDCRQNSGSCQCKQFVTGENCDQCVPGYFQISEENQFGCSPCFCHGHSTECHLAPGYVQTAIKSQFLRGPDDWTAEENGENIRDRTIFNAYKKIIGLQSLDAPAYFVAPKKFLGNQLASYGQKLRFKLKVDTTNGRSVEDSPEDVVITGWVAGEEVRISTFITAQNNPPPSEKLQSYEFLLHEEISQGWQPQLTALQFMSLLANMTAVKIRGSYFSPGEGFIDGVRLETALPGSGGAPADWVEECSCPVGYRGQHCETCEPGYHHERSGRCVPCNCHGHSDYCHVETGVCDCTHNTAGNTCDVCADGYYGDARSATPDDCEQCPCPRVTTEDGRTRTGRCYLSGSTPVCTECPPGRTGARCEQCVDGYYGDPEGLYGDPRPCVQCQCNGNIDLQEAGNCDAVTGRCLRCTDNTAGWRCEVCRPGYWGSALDSRLGCSSCQCQPAGTRASPETGEPQCDGSTGQCSCKDNVEGEHCERCRDTYWNIDSGTGCDPCNCDPIGSLSQSCDLRTGRCVCHPGVTGHRCDVCMTNHYGFSPAGCGTCDCDSRGSRAVSCDQLTGKCSCVSDQVEGRRCERCVENTQSNNGDVAQCKPCQQCYDLVQNAANQHRENLRQLDELLQEIAENPQPVGEDFEEELARLEVEIRELLAGSRHWSAGDLDGDLRDKISNLTGRLRETNNLLAESEQELARGARQGQEAAVQAGQAVDILHSLKDDLLQVKIRLLDDCRQALTEAQARSRKYDEGSEKMSDIASKARRLAETQELDAQEIEEMAGEAFDLSSKANMLAVSGLAEQAKTAGQMHTILSIVENLTGKLTTVESLSFEALSNAQDVYREALSIYRKVYNLESPQVETKFLTDKAYQLTRESDRLKTDATNLLQENQAMLVQIQIAREETETLLNRALSQQEEVENRLDDMKQHRTKGKEAIALGDAILLKARETLDTLRDFENRVSNNREAARAAMKKTNEIEETIRQAVEKTFKASEFLQDTDKDSHLAISLAEESSLLATKASEKAKKVTLESSNIRQSTQDLLRDANSGQRKVSQLFSIFEEKSEIASVDADTAAESLREANHAQSSAEEAARKVLEARQELTDILHIISSVEEPEPGLLEDLERKLDAAEKQYQEAGIELRLTELYEERQRQTSLLVQYREEMEILTSEYLSLEEISRSLPDQCWNKIRLEP